MTRAKLAVSIAGAFIASLGLLVSGAPASIVTIKTTTTQQYVNTLGPSNPTYAEIAAAVGSSLPLTSWYKSDVGGSDSGTNAALYNTAYFNTSTDPEDATITYLSGTPSLGDEMYLVVKDGNHTPRVYIFNLFNLMNVDVDGVNDPNYAWDGKDTLSLIDFWPNGGAISHVEIVSGKGTVDGDGGGDPEVPEPVSLLVWSVLGAATIGAVRFRRRRE